MNDTSDRISALKIDRDAATTGSGGGRTWLLVASVLIVAAMAWWIFWPRE